MSVFADLEREGRKKVKTFVAYYLADPADPELEHIATSLDIGYHPATFSEELNTAIGICQGIFTNDLNTKQVRRALALVNTPFAEEQD